MPSRFAKITLLGMVLMTGQAFARDSAAAADDLLIRILGPEDPVEDGPVTPLGSVYKLFQYAYLVEESLPESPYTCTGRNPEELFCGSPGETLGREAALARSCSPFFSAGRLGIGAEPWRRFWSRHLPDAPAWLRELKTLRPETRVKTGELLSALRGIRKHLRSFAEIERAVMGSVTSGTARSALAEWGSSLRVKTYTWRDDQPDLERTDALGFTGGFAGWLPDGSAIWVSGAGHGRDTFRSALRTRIEPHLTPQVAECVEVAFFDRYPIRTLQAEGNPENGPLRGKVRIGFKNGNSLEFQSDGTLRVDRRRDGLRVTGRFQVDEYIARVIDREVNPQPLEAARAFAVAARTFLYQNAKRSGTCMAIADSSRLQRVSPARASPAALSIARWSDGLVLDGVERIRYHSTASSSNRMSWTDASRLALSGFKMGEILQTHYPGGRISYGTPKARRCDPDTVTAAWIREQSPRWRRRLNALAGFEKPDRLAVCRMPEEASPGRVFARLDTGEIFVPRIRSRNDEVSIIHEYLHLAFRNHPRGRDEPYIETLARSLQEEP